jgi:glycosyltransferase involved in cell wall biosynthesis
MFVVNDMRLDSRVRREASALANAGYAVTVYAVMSEATRHLPIEIVDGYTIARIPMLMRPASRALGSPGAPNTSRFTRDALAATFAATRPILGGALHFLANWQLRWRSWARRVKEQVQPSDVWHAHDLNTLPLAIECARRFGGAVVYDSHELFTEAGATSLLPGSARALLRRLERKWVERVALVMTVNQSIADVLRRSLQIDEVRVLHNCAVPPPGQGISPLKGRIGVGPHERVVLYHGSVTTGRGIDSLVAAFDDPRLERTHLVIMGYGPQRPHIEKLAGSSSASARIHVLPPVPPSDVTAWVAGADVAAMPIEPTTLNHRLSSPNKLFEAIAAGVPVVGPDFVEFRRVVMDQRVGPLGAVHRDARPGSIADAIVSLVALSDADLAAYRRRCRRAAAARWNWRHESRVLLTAYSSLQSLEPARLALHPAPLAGQAE